MIQIEILTNLVEKTRKYGNVGKFINETQYVIFLKAIISSMLNKN